MQMVIKAELDEMKVGLETLGVLELMQKHPIKMRSLFVAYHYHLTSDMMQDMFYLNFSANGSNIRKKEEEVAMLWVYLLQDVESEFAQQLN